MSSRKFILFALLMLILGANQALGAQEFDITPTVLPKNAVVNDGGEPTADNYYWQMLHIKFSAQNSTATPALIITLPGNVFVADVDGNSDYDDEVALSWSTGNTAVFAVNAATDDDEIAIDIATATVEDGDELWIMFPVTTSAAPTGTHVYLTAFMDDDEPDIGAAANEAVTFAAAGSLDLVSFGAILTADDDTTTTYGEKYPTSGDPLLTSALPDLIHDEGLTSANQVESDHLKFWDDAGTTVLKIFDAAADNTNDVTFRIYASTEDRDLIDPTANVLIFDSTTSLEYEMNEGDTGVTPMAVSALQLEGDYYFYVTSDVTSQFILAQSGKLTVWHYPWVELLGFDRNQDNMYDEDGTADTNGGIDQVTYPGLAGLGAGYSDDSSVYVDTGGYYRFDGSVTAGLETTTNLDLYIKANDFNDNADILLYYSEDSTLDVDDVETSGSAPNMTVTDLDGAILIQSGFKTDDYPPYLTYTWDLNVTPYLTATSYTVYAVANDGTHQVVQTATGHSSTNLTVNLVHAPDLIIDALTEYDNEPGTAPDGMDGVQIDLSQNKYIMLSWGKSGVDGDKDLDDSCIISFYLYQDTSALIADMPKAKFAADEVADLRVHANTHQIVLNLDEQSETKVDSYYEWDIEADIESGTWTPVDRGYYHLYAVIDENKAEPSIARLVALGDDRLLHKDEVLTSYLQFLSGSPYATIETPSVDGVTVYPEEAFRFDFNVFDADDDADIGIFIVMEGTTFGQGVENITPMTIQVGGGTNVERGLISINSAAQDRAYLLNSPDGTITAAAAGPTWLKDSGTGAANYYDFILRKPSDAASPPATRYTDDVNGSGVDAVFDNNNWVVYIGLDDQSWKVQMLTAAGHTASVGDWVTSDSGASGIVTFEDGTNLTVRYNTSTDFAALDEIDVGKAYAASDATITTAYTATAVPDFSSEYITLYRAPGMITFANSGEEANQMNVMIAPSNFSVSKGDTTTVELRVADEDSPIDFLDMYVAVEKTYFDIVEGDPNAEMPLTEYAAVGNLTANRVIDDAANNRWILNAAVYASGSNLTIANTDDGSVVASFQVVCMGISNAKANTQIYYVNEPANGWKTQYDTDDVSYAYANSNVTVMPRGYIRGTVKLQGRSSHASEVTFNLRRQGSYVPYDDATFLSANNDDGDSTNGLQYTLGTNGSFTLLEIPDGEWDLTVYYPRYLAKLEEISVYGGQDTLLVNYGYLAGGDATGYTDVSGNSLPDNRIDLLDITFIGTSAYLADSNHAKWDAPDNYIYADINGDDIVDVTDITTATGNYTFGVANDGAQPVYAKPAVQPVLSNTDAFVEVLNVPSELSAGNAYTLQVVVRNAADVKGYFVNLDYDREALSFESITKGDFMEDNTYSFPTIREDTVGLTNAVYGSTVFSGDGLMAEITFTANQDGVFNAGLLDVVEVKLVNSAFMGENLAVDKIVMNGDNLPTVFSLGQNFPNPFNPTTTINFSVPSDEYVKLDIYDILGRHVRTLVSSRYTFGNYNVIWDSRDESGNMVSAGVYFYRINAGSFNTTRRMLLLK